MDSGQAAHPRCLRGKFVLIRFFMDAECPYCIYAKDAPDPGARRDYGEMREAILKLLSEP
jgi:hypothetical protein